MTETQVPLDNSPVIDAGSNGAIASDRSDLDGDGNTSESIPFDQRGEGFDRVVNGTVDLGAVEVQNEQIARIFLNPNATDTVTNDNSTFFGSSNGTGTLLIEDGVTGTETNAQITRIDLPLNLSQATFQVSNNGLEISNGNNAIVSIPSLNQDLDLRLGNGNLILTQTGAQEFTLTNPANSSDQVTIDTSEISQPNVGLGKKLSAIASENGDSNLPLLPKVGGPEEVAMGTANPDNIEGDQDGAILSGGAGLDRFLFDSITIPQQLLVKM